jgi:plastocyanin
MFKLMAGALAALASISAVFLGLAQDDVEQIGVGTPVTWSVDGTPISSYNVVAITDPGGLAFTPKTVTIPVGGTVVWKSESARPEGHTIASTPDNGATFNSGGTAFPIMKGETYANVFTTAGTFTYKCEIHPNMTGTIQVIE